MILIDSHAHLDFENYKDDLDEVLIRAQDSEVKYIINIAIDNKSVLSSIALTEKYSFIYAAIGIHPHEADNYSRDDIKLVEEYSHHPKVVAIGETGLDFYRDYANHDNQRELFRKMISIAESAKKPLVIHNRAASEDTIRIIKEEKAGRYGGVFHCFAGDAEFADRVIRLGFYVSYTGNLTYPRNRLQEEAENIPIERTLLETDCPFMSPQQHRGKRCEPAYVRYTAEKLAEIKGLSLEDIARITSFNVYNVFGVGPKPESTLVYPIRNSLYINLTNRCSCECSFCPRSRNPVVKGHSLKLEDEPGFEDILSAVESYGNGYDELVFCGFGEPTLRFDMVKMVAKNFRKKFQRIRLDTNGHGNLINQRNIAGEIAEIIDTVSVSLNTSDPDEYLRLNHPEFGDKAFPAVLEFIRNCRNAGLEVIGSVVGFPNADIEGTEKLAKELGIKFRVRKYNDLG